MIWEVVDVSLPRTLISMSTLCRRSQNQTVERNRLNTSAKHLDPAYLRRLCADVCVCVCVHTQHRCVSQGMPSPCCPRQCLSGLPCFLEGGE